MMQDVEARPCSKSNLPTNSTVGHLSDARREPAHHGSINSLRGAVCLGVVIIHIYVFLENELSAGYPGRILGFIFTYCRLGVESFFVLAGYFLAHTFRPTSAGYFSVPRYVLRRFLRLAAPYWIVVSTLVSAQWLAHLVLHRTYPLPSFWKIGQAMFFVQDVFANKSFPFFTLWSMAPLFQMYTLWALVYWLSRKVLLGFNALSYEATTQKIMVGLSLVVLEVSILFAKPPANEGWQLPGWAWAFAAGAMTYWRVRSLVSWPVYGIATGLLIPIAVACHGPTIFAAKVTVCCLLLLLLDRGLRFPEGPLSRMLSHIGQRSYSIYLVHGPVGYRFLSWLALAIPVKTRASASMELLIAVSASIFAGLVFYKFVERPTSRLAGLVEYRR